MKYSNLGNTDIIISNLCLGTWAFAADKTWGAQDEKESIETILTALENGINFIDTAEAYGNGHSEEVLGKALKGRRHQAIVASKVADTNLNADNLVEACEKSLKRLQTDYIDLYQVHWPNKEISMDETFTAMNKLVKEGKVRSIGVCNFGVKHLNEALNYSQIQTNQLPYSLLWRAIEFDIVTECLEKNTDILAYSPLSQGLLTGKYKSISDVPEGRLYTRFYNYRRSEKSRHGEEGCEEELFNTIQNIRNICSEIGQPMNSVAILWLLNQNVVGSVLVGARTPQQIIDNIKAAEYELSHDIIIKLTEATEDLKQKLGNNPDMWEGKEKSRFK